MPAFDYVTTKREDVAPLPEIGRFRRGMKFYTRLNVFVYRLSRGRWMRTAMGGHPICLVAFVGKVSGKTRRIPLIHVPLGDDELLVGSQAGLDRDPVWVRSIEAHPDVEISVDGRTRALRARRVSDDEKRELWPHLCSIYPAYDEYQARTDRNIPVFRCAPREA